MRILAAVLVALVAVFALAAGTLKVEKTCATYRSTAPYGNPFSNSGSQAPQSSTTCDWRVTGR